MNRPSPLLNWQRWTALPQPPLSLAYLAAVRAGLIFPGFVFLGCLAVMPVLSTGLGIAVLTRAPAAARRTSFLWLFLAVGEIVWAVLALAIAGFAVAAQAG